ncbi:hypothetical protein FQR65_LT17404 [Abscondita terminalis]|nr:hypothetical protein FQR65_LT17404 [Abscondita terminalis]
MDFAVVTFIEEDDAPGIIHTNWMDDKEEFCYYPSSKVSEAKKQKYIIKRKNPEIDWEKHPIRVLNKYSTFVNAKGHLSEAEMTDNIDDENNEVATVRKRKHKHIVLPGEENEVTEPVKKKEQPKNNSEKQLYPVPPRTTSPTSSMFDVSSLDSEEVHEVRRPLSRGSTFSQSDTFTSKSTPGHGEELEQLKNNHSLIWQTLDQYTRTPKSIENKLDRLLIHFQSGEGLPKSLTQNTDERIDDTPSLLTMPTSGNNLKGYICKLLGKILSDELAEAFSLTGKTRHSTESKMSFQATSLYKYIYEISLKKFSNGDDTTLRGAISDLVHASQISQEVER